MFVGSCFLFCVVSPDRTVSFLTFSLLFCFVFCYIKILTWTFTMLRVGPILTTLPQTKRRIVTEKRQSIITLRHEGQSMRNISRISRFLQVQLQIPSSTIMKLVLMRTADRKGRPRVTSAAEDKVIRVTSLRNCSPHLNINCSEECVN